MNLSKGRDLVFELTEPTHTLVPARHKLLLTLFPANRALVSRMDRRLDELDPRERSRVVAQAVSRSRLLGNEIAWRDVQPFLQTKGYMLRKRFRPDWIPSWTLPENKEKDPRIFEDFEYLPSWPSLITDATRVSDGRLVSIKRVLTSGTELQIVNFLSSDNLASDPRNHCVPILDYFCDDQDPKWTYIAMPFLQYVDGPPFETVSDVVDFVSQMLEGLAFLHEHHVAHRDCEYANLMMDATPLFPEGYHTVRPFRDPTGLRYIKPLSRAGKSVKYYYVDFGLASHLPKNGPQRVLGGKGRDKSVPELSRHRPYDPFKVDIYILGNMIRQTIYDQYSNVEFLLPLINHMMPLAPKNRISAAEAVDEWRIQQDSMSELTKFWPLRSRKESWIVNVTLDGITAIGFGARTLLGWWT